MTDAVSTNTMTDRPLNGLSVLVTRPLNQASSLISQLQLQGANVLHQPAIAIEAAFDSAQLPLLQSINNYDLLIFISQNAVEHGLSLVSNYQTIDKSLQIAAIGQSTQQTLLVNGFDNVISPQAGFDSETLLATAALSAEQIKDKKVLIIRGGEGRELLKDALESRSANVDYLDVYRRQRAALVIDPTDLSSLDIITVSSQQGLENLLSMFDAVPKKQILDKILITPSKRCSERARELGFNQIETAANATDNAMLSCIVDKIINSDRAKDK